MSNKTHHKMDLIKTHPSGAEEWQCQVCNRHFVVSWPPNYKKVMLAIGNEHAVHNGNKGGITLQSPQITQNGSGNNHQDQEPALSDEWHAAFDELDFGDFSQE